MRHLKEQIIKLSKGIFEYDTPVIEVVENSIELNVDNNTIVQGQFTVKSSNKNQDIHGYVYSDNSKVTIDNVRRILSSYFAWLEDEDAPTDKLMRYLHVVVLKEDCI